MTPRTDSVIRERWETHSCEEVPAEFAREIECELEKSKSILQWIDQNPEAFERIVVRKSWGRKVWWRGPDGHHSDTLRECVERAKKTYPLLPNAQAQR